MAPRDYASIINQEIASERASVRDFSADLANLSQAADFSKMSSGFKRVGDDAGAAGDKAAGAFDGLQKTVEKVTLGAAALATAATATLLAVGAKAVSIGDAMKQAAGATDQTLLSIGNVGSVATRAGLEIGSLGGAFLAVQKGAKEGDDKVTAALKAIGLSAKDVASISQDALAVKLADAFAKSANSSNKAATGVALFGEEVAGKLVPQLDQSGAHMRELMAASDRAGAVIGPDLAAKIAGTSAQMQHLRDAAQELAETARGRLLQTFVSVKPAIDGLIASFTDFTQNLARATEYFFDLDGAGRKAADATGILTDASNWFAGAMIRVTTAVEEFAVRSVQWLDSIGVSFKGLSDVVAAFARDVAVLAANSATALYEAFSASIGGVIKLFGDLASAGKSALSFDLSGARAALGQFGSDVEATADKIKLALSPAKAFPATGDAMAKMREDAKAEAAALDTVIQKLEAQKKAQLDLIAAGGAKAPQPGTKTVGDPTPPDKDDDTEKARAAIEAIEGEIAVLRSSLAMKREIYESDTQLKIMSDSQKLAATKAALDQEYQAEKDLLQKEIALGNATAEEHQRSLNKLKELDARYAADVQKALSTAAEAFVQPWHQMIDGVADSFRTGIEGMIGQTMRFVDVMRKVTWSIIDSFLKMGIDVVADWGKAQISMVAKSIAGETAKTEAVATGTAARESLTLAGFAAEAAAAIGNVLKQIAAFAAQAFAGVTAFLAPILGPAAVGPAAATEAAVMSASYAIPSFDIGAYSLPSDTLAMLHRNELVMPAGPAQAFRDMLENGAMGPGGQGGRMGDVHLNVSAFDGRSVAALFKNNGRELAQVLQDVVRRNPSLR